MSKISLKHSGGNVVSLNSPTNAPGSADVAFKLPNADGSDGQALVTDGSGNLSFGNVAGGSGRNLIINGAMQVAQRGTSSTSVGYQTVDRFQLRASNTDNWAFTQTHEDVAVNEPPFYTDGFRKYYDIQTTTVETGNIGSDEYVDIFQRIEANNTVQLGYGQSGGTAKTLTLSFWVRSYQTGTFVFYIYLSGGKMQVKNYTVSASNTWEKKSFIIEPDGADAQLPSVNYSLQCGWMLAAGSNYTSGSTSTSYTTYANANLGANQTADITSSTNNFFHLTGVQLEVGSVATDFEHRSFGDELAKCQRYFYKVTKDGTDAEVTNMPIGTGVYYTANDFRCILDHPVEMRAAPTLTSNDNSGSYYIHFNSSHDGIDRLDSFHNSRKRSMVRNTAHASGTQGYPGLLHQENSNSSLTFSAEL